MLSRARLTICCLLAACWALAATGAHAQELGDQAVLETRQPEVQWSPATATEWQGVPARQSVQPGTMSVRGPAPPRWLPRRRSHQCSYLVPGLLAR